MAQKQQQEQSHADAIRLYWTPERIRSAVPEDHHLRISGKKLAASLGDNVPPTVVQDNTRKTPPYQSVGKLLYKKGEKEYQATAYVVNTGKGRKNIVFTAAHNLYDPKGKAEKYYLYQLVKPIKIQLILMVYLHKLRKMPGSFL